MSSVDTRRLRSVARTGTRSCRHWHIDAWSSGALALRRSASSTLHRRGGLQAEKRPQSRRRAQLSTWAMMATDPILGHLGSIWATCWANVAPRWIHQCIWPNVTPRWASMAPKQSQDGVKMNHCGAKIGQCGANGVRIDLPLANGYQNRFLARGASRQWCEDRFTARKWLSESISRSGAPRAHLGHTSGTYRAHIVPTSAVTPCGHTVWTLFYHY